MKIGYSFWGFLGAGVTDTPDGGRSHRRPLIDALRARGHEIVFLQADRDRTEAADGLGGTYSFDSGYPDIDVLFLEWRWPIEGRNTTPCGAPGHTCDLHRQAELLQLYSRHGRTPIVIWDKDRQMSAGSPWRQTSGVRVCEAALDPTPGAHRLLFPVADALLDTADARALAACPRPVALAYVGNQYDRDEAFDRFFAPAARLVTHKVAGKWPRTLRWPQVAFIGRVPFEQVHDIYAETLATVLLLPARYEAAGQMTQRIFEAVLAGCLPLAPAGIRHVETFVPAPLIVRNGQEVVRRLDDLRALAGSREHVELIAACLERLKVFRLTTQVQALETILAQAIEQSSGVPARGGSR